MFFIVFSPFIINTKFIYVGKEMYEFWQHSGLTPAGTSSTTLTNTSSQSLFVAGAESKYASDSWLRDPSRKPPRLFVCHEDLFSGLFSVWIIYCDFLSYIWLIILFPGHLFALYLPILDESYRCSDC